MLSRSFAPWVLVLAMAGCGGGESATVAEGQAPPNVPSAMPDARPSGPVGTPEERAKIVADRIKQADEAIAAKEYDKAIDKLREAILTEPKDRKVILALARANLAKSVALARTDLAEAYRSSLSASNYLRTIRDYYHDLNDEEKAFAPEIYFAEATQQAMSNRAEETTAALNDAIGAGFTDLDRIRESPDWKKIIADPNFKKVWEPLDKKFPSKKK